MKKAPMYTPLFPYLAAKKNAGLLAEGELVIDNFAGIGGASSGMEAALGRPVDHAINHDPVAVSLHRVNHPHSHHSVEDVWQVDPREITRGQPVALCWFSPTCTHFSKAKGAALLDRGIRGLAWVAVRWAALVQPRVIILENVEEFQQWGPLTADGRPDATQKGRTFNSFVNALRYQGYEVEWRELRACDYGTPTIRRRLFLIARRDGLPIIWPAPTHAKPADPRVQSGLLKPYATAASCIDWSLPTPSIFDRKKPLVTNTLNRVAQGIRRYVLESAQPYIVTCNHGGEGFRGQALDQPFVTVTAANEAHGLTQPVLAPCLQDRMYSRPGRAADEPLATITTTHNKTELMTVTLAPCVINKQHGNPPRSVAEPLSTVTTNHNKNELLVGHLTKFNTGSVGQAADAPIATIVAGGTPARESTGNVHGLIAVSLIKTDNQRSRSSCTYPADGVLPTVVTKNSFGLVTGHLMTYYGPKSATETRGSDLRGPVGTQTTENRHAVVSVHLVQHNGGKLPPADANYPVTAPARTVTASGGPQALVSGALVACGGRGAQARPKALDECMHTVTSKADMTLTTAHLTAYYSANGKGDVGQDLTDPMRTVPTHDRFGLSAATLMRQFGTSTAAEIDAPVGTITTEGGGKTSLIVAGCAPALTPAQHARATEVHALLSQYLGEALTPYSRDGLVVLQVRGEWFVLADIGMRMLSPAELAKCQGFRDDYVLDRTAEGVEISKARQVRGIGNSVCPQLAEVLTRAQLGAVLEEAAD